MNQFFRKVRQSLLVQNKLNKYMLYVLGEIVLVVLGILIALAINNRNEDRLLRNKEQVYLAGLKNEFEVSKTKLQNLIRVNQQNYREALEIIRFMDQRDSLPDEASFSKLMYNALAHDVSFNPNNAFLNEMVHSGSLKDVRDVELRRHLLDWDARLADIAKQEGDLQNQREKIIDLSRTQAFNLRRILDLSGVSEEVLGISSKETNTSNLDLLQSRDFENNLLLFVLSSKATEQEHYLPLMQELDIILDLLKDAIET